MPIHKAVMWHFIALILTPFVGIMETFGIFIAPLQLRNFRRNPTPKFSSQAPLDDWIPTEETTLVFLPPPEPLLENSERKRRAN